MNVQIRKWIGLVALVVSTACVISYAEKGEGKSVTLPDVVKNAIQKAYPQATFGNAKTGKEFEMYEVVVVQNARESEVAVTPEGDIIEAEIKTDKGNIPDAVSKALSNAAQGAEIKAVEQKTAYYVIKAVKLDTPETAYTAELVKDGKRCEVKISANGTVLGKSEWQKCEKEDEEDDNEQKVSIDQVPAAAKATIMSEAGKGTVKEIEQETKDGKTIYGADLIIDGKKFEIKVSSDGKLISKQAEDKKD